MLTKHDDLFDFNYNRNTYSANASSLGIPVGKYPISITLIPTYTVFNFYETITTPDNQETLGWLYKSNKGFELIINND